MIQRHFFAGAAEATADRQGRVMIPVSLAKHAALGREVVVAGVRDHLEIWDRAAWRTQVETSKGGRSMLPNALHQTRLITFLFSPRRCGLLDVQPGDTVVDATFGAGGHAGVLAADLGARPVHRHRPRSVCRARTSSASTAMPGSSHAFCAGPSRRARPAGGNGVEADAILLDLGVSSMQLDRPERGFSYAVDAPLDMRMDPSAD